MRRLAIPTAILFAILTAFLNSVQADSPHPNPDPLTNFLQKLKKKKNYRLQGQLTMGNDRFKITMDYEIRHLANRGIYTCLKLKNLRTKKVEKVFLSFYDDHILQLQKKEGKEPHRFIKYLTPKGKSLHHKYLNRLPRGPAGNYIMLHPEGFFNELKRTTLMDTPRKENSHQVVTFQPNSKVKSKYKGDFARNFTKFEELKVIFDSQSGLPIKTKYKVKRMEFTITYKFEFLEKAPQKKWLQIPRGKKKPRVKDLRPGSEK